MEQGVIKVDWKGLGAYVTHLTQMGRPIPAWITKTYPEYKIKYVVKQNGIIGNRGPILGKQSQSLNQQGGDESLFDESTPEEM